MSKFDPDEHPHTRYNPLKDEWVFNYFIRIYRCFFLIKRIKQKVLISPHRMKRPWQGQVEKPSKTEIKRHDPANPLCPNAVRPNGVQNPDYKETFVFDNDFPALFDYDLVDQEFPQEETTESAKSDLFKITPVKGKCKVMCFHPYSDLTLSTMKCDDIAKVISKWIEELNTLSSTYDWVQIFENKGAIMGCSNPHPHCQIWASSFLPNDVKTKHRTQSEYFAKHNKIMLVEYLHYELEAKLRIVAENKDWAVLVPYWAVWPYETILLPKRHIIRLNDIKEEEKLTLADIMKRLLIKYDNLFQCSFP
jgi:UDPglucose--hexose-1-phosphate uridylyltransferase